MPVYGYRCTACGAADEIASPMSVIAFRVIFCNWCGREMRRVYTSPGIIFKGGGWAGKRSA